jgi:FixJ family two-component response regulator
MGTPEALRPTVAVVDDDPSVRKAARRLIRSAGIDAQAFASAEDFLAAAPATGRTGGLVLVLDVHLPGLGGLELQARLAAEGRRIPIVFITAYESEPVRHRALAAGAVDFLLKPFDDEALLEALARALAAARSSAPAGGPT